MSNPVWKDDLEMWVDEETGEILDPPSQMGKAWQPSIENDEEAEYFLKKRLEALAAIRMYDEQQKAILANIEAKRKRHAQKLEWLDRTYSPLLEKYATERLVGAKTRTVQFTYGKASFRKVKQTFQVKEGYDESAKTWAKINCPEAVQIKEVLVKTPLNEIMDALPEEIFNIVPEHDTFKIESF